MCAQIAMVCMILGIMFFGILLGSIAEALQVTLLAACAYQFCPKTNCRQQAGICLSRDACACAVCVLSKAWRLYCLSSRSVSTASAASQ